MKISPIIIFILFTFYSTFAQDNFVDGKIVLINGEISEGQVNDQFWERIPEFFEYKSAAGVRKTLSPRDVKEISIGSKAIYKSFEFLYDSSSRIKDELPTRKDPQYKKAHSFLKVLVDSDMPLLTAMIDNVERYFIQKENKVEELVNHIFQIHVNGQALRQENRLYVSQLAKEFSSCLKNSISMDLEYNDITLMKLFTEYATCKGVQAKQYQKKEPSVVLKGVVGTVAYDQMINNFNGGPGVGWGGFVTIFLPHRVYKNSVYMELTYRMFGDQLWTGLDYTGRPYKETHQVRSMKFTSILRKRVSAKPSLPHAGYTYLGAGLSTSFGLKDLYQRGPYVASKVIPFVGVILNAGVHVTKNVVLDIKLERGSGIRYSDYLNQDNREPLSKGYYSFQGSVILEF